MSGAPAMRIRLVFGSAGETERLLPPTTILSRALHAEITAMFVGESELAAACRLPIRNLVGFAGETIDVALDDMVNLLRREASSCLDLLRTRLQEHGLPWHFESTTDPIFETDRTGFAAGDIVAVAAYRPIPSSGLLFRRLLRHLAAGGLLLVVPADKQMPMQAITIGSTAASVSQTTIDLAGKIAAATGAGARPRPLIGITPGQIVSPPDSWGLVVAEVTHDLLDEAWLAALLSRARLPVLIVPRRDDQ